MPPIGFVTPYLPAAHTRLVEGGVTYCIADGIVFRAVGPNFMVVTNTGINPMSAIAPVAMAAVPDFIIEPAAAGNGSGLLKDRDDCIRRATSATGFDPALIGGGVDADEFDDHQAAFDGAYGECLVGKGYRLR